MPRPKDPLTPAASTEPTAQEKNMEGTFALPPAAMNRSPTSPGIQRKRTLSGSTKKPEDLPPPPSRARKIIQMKPKDSEETISTPSVTKTTSPKRKQPSSTSAAGRKIARKTAHSIIERRRRSKMNEEFGVLKDMIPACAGVDMHKLAILQAGIEYVRYLQGCVEKLQQQQQERGDKPNEDQSMSDPPNKWCPSEQADYSTAHRRSSSTTNSTNASPIIDPSNNSPPRYPPASSSSQLTTTYSTSPPPLLVQTPIPTGISPAFNAIHFSPDLSRTSTLSSHQQTSFIGKPSPHILPLPQAAMPLNSERLPSEGAAEATATAALMMLTNDRRSDSVPGRRDAKIGGMSVRELLSG